ncbi:MAG: hypothetical protein M5U26_02850 [Planctomycetota bacterium]|nr:hypothetical protein [Planctomycetota bacterium]
MKPYGPVLAHFTYDAAPTSRRLADFRTRLASIGASPTPPPPARPFMLVTPLGREGSRSLRHQLRAEGIVPLALGEAAGWPELATALYVKKIADEERALKALVFENLWRWLFPSGRAEIWDLSRPEYELVARLKPILRHKVANWRVRVSLPAFSFYANLHPFHVPDVEDLGREWRLIWNHRLGVERRGHSPPSDCRGLDPVVP